MGLFNKHHDQPAGSDAGDQPLTPTEDEALTESGYDAQADLGLPATDGEPATENHLAPYTSLPVDPPPAPGYDVDRDIAT